MRGLVLMLVAALVIAGVAFYFIWTNANALTFSEHKPQASVRPQKDSLKPETESATAEEEQGEQERKTATEPSEEKPSAAASSEHGGPKPEEPLLPLSKQPPKDEIGSRPEQRPQVHIMLPDELRGVQFGIAPGGLAQRFPPAWQKETRDALVLVHHPQGSTSKEYRFEFTNNMLEAVELRFKVSNGQEQASMYDDLQKECSQRFGSLPGSRRASWQDDNTTLCLEKGLNFVSLRFTLKR